MGITGIDLDEAKAQLLEIHSQELIALIKAKKKLTPDDETLG
jgi:plasmid maintenance system antidote protein VapI